ncbi:hypothetical protein KIPB_011712, partial [Kipferlia bialata]|eukprot:g11712.t1
MSPSTYIISYYVELAIISKFEDVITDQVTNRNQVFSEVLMDSPESVPFLVPDVMEIPTIDIPRILDEIPDRRANVVVSSDVDEREARMMQRMGEAQEK